VEVESLSTFTCYSRTALEIAVVGVLVSTPVALAMTVASDLTGEDDTGEQPVSDYVPLTFTVYRSPIT
jgi:hypothetical protein